MATKARSAELLWFKLFAREWLGRFIGTSLAAQGALIRLFCASWERRELLTDSEACRRVAGADKHEWRRIWPAVHRVLEERGGVLVSPWLEELRAEAIASRDAKSQAGLAGNQARWGGRAASHRDRTAIAERSQPESQAVSQEASQNDRSQKSESDLDSPLRGAPVRRRRDSAARQRVFEHWKKAWNHPGAKLDAKRSRVIDAALQGYLEADLCRSIDGYKLSPHHCGQNDRRTRYDDIELFLRDSKHVEAGLQFALGAANGKPPRAPMTDAELAQLAKFVDSRRGSARTVDEIILSTPEPLRKEGWEQFVKSSYANHRRMLQ